MQSQRFFEHGYAIVPDVADAAACEHIIAELTHLPRRAAGSRSMLALNWCRELAVALKLNQQLKPLLPELAVAVQCTIFEKSQAKNWGVGLHQDLSIAVRERVDMPGGGVWTRKQGVLYTQPPAELLDTLLAVRVHLDPCPATAGPLRVVPGSHRMGRVSESAIAPLKAQHGEIECVADRGAALVLRPLLLHASSKAVGNAPRRVLHFLFGPRQLPYGLAWHQAV